MLKKKTYRGEMAFMKNVGSWIIEIIIVYLSVPKWKRNG